MNQTHEQKFMGLCKLHVNSKFIWYIFADVREKIGSKRVKVLPLHIISNLPKLVCQNLVLSALSNIQYNISNHLNFYSGFTISNSKICLVGVKKKILICKSLSIALVFNKVQLLKKIWKAKLLI